MRRYSVPAMATVLLLTLTAAGVGDSATLSDHLSFLEPLIGYEWTGHYATDADAEFTHVLTWESVLDGQAVRSVKRVDEASFLMETLFYWDPGSSQVVYLSVSNRGQVTRGVASSDGDIVELLGSQITPEGEIANRYTFHVNKDGILEDRFYLREGDAWRERHLILYRAVPHPESPSSEE